MEDLFDDIARGCLENGEAIEARWGTGWWSRPPEPTPDYYGAECPYCKEEALYCDGEFLMCEKCGRESKE